jgi:hypothetical protein
VIHEIGFSIFGTLKIEGTINMGESKRRADRGGNQFSIAARGVVLQRGQNFREKILNVPPELLADVRFNDSLDSWMRDSPRGNFEFLVYAQRYDDREVWLQAIDIDHLERTILPRLFGEYHARRECAVLHPIVTSETTERIQEILIHSHPTPPGQIIAPISQRRSSTIHGELVLIRIPRKAVDQQESAGILRVMDMLVATAHDAERNAQRVFLVFDGYDNDPREVFEVEEVRTFLKTVTKFAPWWLHLAYPATYITWFSSIVPYTNLTKDPNGVIKVNYVSGGLEDAVETFAPPPGVLLRDVGLGEVDADTLLSNIAIALGVFMAGNGNPGSDPIIKAMIQNR